MRSESQTPSGISPHSDPRGVLAMTLASFLFSWGFIIVRAAGLPPAWTAGFRLTFGAALLLGVAKLRRMPFHFSPVVVAAGVLFGVHQLAFIGATQATSIALVTLVQALQPLLVAPLSRRALQEDTPKALYACGVLGVAGVGIVVYANRGLPTTTWYGFGLSLLNLVSYTAFFLASKRARLEGAHPISLTGTALAIALLTVLPFLGNAPDTIEPWQVGLLAFMAWVPGNGHVLVNWAHPRVSATLAALTTSLVPVFASIWAHLIFDEPYGPLHLLGTLLTLSAIELGRRATMPPRAP